MSAPSAARRPKPGPSDDVSIGGRHSTVCFAARPPDETIKTWYPRNPRSEIASVGPHRLWVEHPGQRLAKRL